MSIPEAIRFRAKVDSVGKLHPENALHVRARLAAFMDRWVYVEVSREKKIRSLTANAYLHGVVYKAISEWSGFEPDEVHLLLKAMFLPPITKALPTGEEVTIPGSTAILDTVAFSEYVRRCKEWAAGQGCWVPEPGEAWDAGL